MLGLNETEREPNTVDTRLRSCRIFPQALRPFESFSRESLSRILSSVVSIREQL